MFKDRYDNSLNTNSEAAVAGYIEGVDRVLAGSADMCGPFEAALAVDEGFALAHAGLARAAVLSGDMPKAKAAIARAKELAEGGDHRVGSHINALGLLFAGKAAAALEAVREHVAVYPRDALVAQLGTSVFGLIGFSGQAGREAELLAYTTSLAPHYGEDWWFLSQHAFSQCETGRLTEADQTIERALAGNPLSAHSAHVRSHVYYEAGEVDAGISYLEDWLPAYDRGALMHGHLSWHSALWSLEQGQVDRMWATVDASVKPDAAQGLPINVLTDTASILHRAELAGEAVAPERWQQVSDYAAQFFPKTGQSFCDMHAALAHAMAGRGDLLAQYLGEANGFAADVVESCAASFAALAAKDWSGAANGLAAAMADDARLGGSRAQRDLLDLSMVNALLRQGKGDEAQLILRMRRPVLQKEAAL